MSHVFFSDVIRLIADCDLIHNVDNFASSTMYGKYEFTWNGSLDSCLILVNFLII